MEIIQITEAEIPYIALGALICLGYQFILNLLNLLFEFIRMLQLNNEVKYFRNRHIKEKLKDEEKDVNNEVFFK